MKLINNIKRWVEPVNNNKNKRNCKIIFKFSSRSKRALTENLPEDW